MESPRASLLNAVYDHVVLPAHIEAPQVTDEALNGDLSRTFGNAWNKIRQAANLPDDQDVLGATIALSKTLNIGNPSEEILLKAFGQFSEPTCFAWLIIHVSQQNAALLVHKDERYVSPSQILPSPLWPYRFTFSNLCRSGNHVIFEAFEASASAGAVLGSPHALKWTFPGRAAAIPLDTFTTPDFQAALAKFLEEASETAFDCFAARATKSGKSVIEIRDTPNPGLITEMLMSLLEGLGEGLSVTPLIKKVRDEVILEPGSNKAPWRRSPYWLMIRVASQRILSDSPTRSDAEGRWLYKYTMCAVMATLLLDGARYLHPEKLLTLQAKLCRRLAKLEAQGKDSQDPVLKLLQSGTRDWFTNIITQSKQSVINQWKNHKQRSTRVIPLLPSRVPDADLVLQLPHSRAKLEAILDFQVKPSQRLTLQMKAPLLHKKTTISEIEQLGSQCKKFSLLGEQSLQVMKRGFADSKLKCITISNHITNYISVVHKELDGVASLASQYLLNLFELWVALDFTAANICPLLLQYHPIFVPEALDMLCFALQSDMERLACVQKYLAKRVQQCMVQNGNIFKIAPKTTSFAQGYVQARKANEVDCEEHSLSSLLSRINQANHSARVEKGGELKELSDKYDQLTLEMARGECRCTRNPDGTLDVKGCNKCWKKRSRKRIRIKIHEDFLPTAQQPQATVLAELALPKYLAAYREATWALVKLGLPSAAVKVPEPKAILSDFKPLSDYWITGRSNTASPSSFVSSASTSRSTSSSSSTSDSLWVASGSICLASHVKSYTQTHFGQMKLPKKKNEVLLPFAAQYSYYDSEAKIWLTGQDLLPWYHNMLGSWLPNEIIDPFSDPSTYLTEAESPSSYEIVASQFQHPRNMSIHEFGAYQRAISGVSRRWITLVMELGSTNLNFSDPKTSRLFERLALQSGPLRKDDDSDALREAHQIFRQESFCQRLEEQIQKRLDGMASNHRDVSSLHVLVTLSIRLYFLAQSEAARTRASSLLRKTRTLAVGWIDQLRTELRNSSDGNVAKKCASHALWAALLCRQSFVVFNHGKVDGDIPEAEDIHQFFQSSIALSENLFVGLDQLSPDLMALLRSDLTLVHSMRDSILEWTSKFTSYLEKSIGETWADAGSTNARVFSSWLPLEDSEWLLATTIATSTTNSQIIHYHILHGHLLIDGKPLGTLPLDIREHEVVRELFPNQNLLARPSGLMGGMEYHLVTPVEDHEIHFGYRNDQLVIRAKFKDHLWEHVPRTVFKNEAGVLDIPYGLVEECVHWLNLNTGRLEMRRKPRIWYQLPGNWILNVKKRRAIRNRTADKLGTALVEPRSSAGTQIYQILQSFEELSRVTIFQPLHPGGKLSVEMKRLELRFDVRKGLLSSAQLRAEVDPDQDIGCLYGLESKLVLRSIINQKQRSVLIPVGGVPIWKRVGIHVGVQIENKGTHAQFFVDPVLGRLKSPPEPALLYLKALVHALTSFPLPDELTGRTGTEEALLSLKSGSSRPWTSLGGIPKTLLATLSRLGPKRVYYPPDKALYQVVEWDKYLTSTVQHEDLALEALRILKESEMLDSFSLSKGALEEGQANDQDLSHKHLALRGMIRRQLYERINCDDDSELLEKATTKHYSPRDGNAQSDGSKRVFRTTQSWLQPSMALEFCKPGDVGNLLESAKDFGRVDGFTNSLVVLPIHSLLEDDIRQLWAPLVQKIRSTDSDDLYGILFSLATFSFGNRSPAAISWLVNFAEQTALQNFEPPSHEVFTNFQPKEQQNTQWIKHQIESQRVSRAKLLKQASKGKKRNKVIDEEFLYETEGHKERDNIAAELLQHLPTSRQEFRALLDKLTIEFHSVDGIWRVLESELNRLAQNRDLARYLAQLDQCLQQLQQDFRKGRNGDKKISILKSFLSPHPKVSTKFYDTSMPENYKVPRLKELTLTSFAPGSRSAFRESQQSLFSQPLTDNIVKKETDNKPPKSLEDLQIIASSFSSSSDITRRQYGTDLNDSIQAAIQNYTASTTHDTVVSSEQNYVAYLTAINNAKHHVKVLLDELKSILAHSYEDTGAFRWLEAGNLWPCVNLTSLLGQLRASQKLYLSDNTKSLIVRLALETTALQRLLRIQDATLHFDARRETEELANPGHKNWEPLTHPEWLLLEIDNDILIRPVQIEVANGIIDPESRANSVLQMSMGNGKYIENPLDE